MSEKNKDFYMNSLNSNLYRRGFSSLQKGFMPSYITQFVGLVLISLLVYLSGRLMRHLVDNHEPIGEIPYTLIFSLLGIVVLLTLVSLFIVLMSNSVSVHAFGKSSIGETSGVSSIVYGVKKSLNWFLIAFVIVTGCLVYFGIAGLIAYKFLGRTPMIISVVMVIVFGIASLILYPVLNLVQPIMILENIHLGRALPRALKLGFSKYWKAVGVFFVSYSTLFVFNFVFVVLLILFFQPLNPSHDHFGITGTVPFMTSFLMMIFAYISVTSMVLMMNSSFSVSFVSELMANETSPEDAYNKISSSL